MGKTQKLKYCARCGSPLPTQQNGRPQRYCRECHTIYRKDQKRRQYLEKIKFPGINDKELEIKLKELERFAQRKRDRADFEREFEYMREQMNRKDLKWRNLKLNPERLLGHPIDNAFINRIPELTTSKKQHGSAHRN